MQYENMLKHDDSSAENVARRLIFLRKYLCISQKQFAIDLNTSAQHVSNWESARNRLSLQGALAIVEVYGVTLDFLFLNRYDTLPAQMRSAWLVFNRKDDK
tara:strand:- start:1798 stop:2100 length:303 start_codon:yes stop_codon:yes gene_type:complete